MSCVLRAGGPDFAVDRFLAESSFKPVAIGRKGQRQWPEVPIANSSGFHVIASEADFSKLQVQIADAIQFVERNHAELSRLSVFPGIERISLDFGIKERNVAAQSERFPPKLLRLLGDLGIWLEFSLYPFHKPRGF